MTKCNHRIFEVAEVTNCGWSATSEISNMGGKLYLDVYLCKPMEVNTKTCHRRISMRYCPRCGAKMDGGLEDGKVD